MDAELIAVSAIVPTRHRAGVLARTLASLALQEVQPREILVVDASEDSATRDLCASEIGGLQSRLVYLKAGEAGAASQRNEGVRVATQECVWFLDDDILLEPGCVSRLWGALLGDGQLGAVNAMITNQHYLPPGRVSRVLFSVLHGSALPSFAGRVIGPAINLLPSDDAALPEVVAVEWLNTTCTLYRRAALPTPVFDPLFTGYSLMEDLTLSLRVGRHWRLANVRSARIFHDSQPGSHKADVAEMAAMELLNRHYVMARVLERRRLSDYARLALWEFFQLFVCALRAQSRPEFLPMWRGKWRAFRALRSEKSPAPPAAADASPAPRDAPAGKGGVLIGIVTRNRADILPRAIESALAQRGCPIRVAVLDDGSSDETSGLREKYPDVSWTRWSTNRGLMAARNHLMVEAGEDYFVSLDDDAWFLQNDEVALAFEYLETHDQVAALGFDILSPDVPSSKPRTGAQPAALFIGCGHVLRLAAVRLAGAYESVPGNYGGEEKDLCLRLLDGGCEIVSMPGVHVWHERTVRARDGWMQHRSGVCNDLVMTLRRTPLPVLPLALAAKFYRHWRFSRANGLSGACREGFGLFARSIPSVLASRRAVRMATLKVFLKRQRP